VEIEITRITPAQNVLHPRLIIQTTVTHSGSEVPITITGQLLTSDGQRIAAIGEEAFPAEPIHILARGSHITTADRKTNIDLSAQLDEKALHHISDLRATKPQGDVRLRFDLVVTCIVGNVKLATFRIASEDFVQYVNEPRFQTGQSNMWVLSGDGGPEYMAVRKDRFTKHLTIPGSDWIGNFAPPFGLGSFVLIELPEFNPSTTLE